MMHLDLSGISAHIAFKYYIAIIYFSLSVWFGMATGKVTFKVSLEQATKAHVFCVYDMMQSLFM